MLKTNKIVRKGVRFCVINAGTEDYFVENAEKIVYKIEITAQIFEEWLENQLMPNVPLNSIVMIIVQFIHVSIVKPRQWRQISKQLKNGF